ncbi:MAG: heme ABC transporter ATP-binding protein [Chloroflexi bacterium GWB2_49_20]|nr:MAG: heme ABC transporter ATP-binding protein [Chloroflexi bacterium GWB2_49_20]OGN78076.1 MAG: heme ABC transporter ATP-binding protein [Chloroflexi bacterium GWC2_49_37]OGN85114.1 MAG: heme ABC transporter ATP-binding protein [Chloroflexi bacterium GWD2_49_16]HBG74845.1 heme ABC transporter ATP-binding protein [Anaerolineae bacterium]HCC78429.1 heme ABC transporter ATP-binding protein [Anaerolineae bacterium]
MASGASTKEKQQIKRVEMCNIIKYFPGVLANDRVCFDINQGEVHALLGENGAGKSTLMRQLYGLYRPDEGEILINSKPYTFNSPADAIEAGIGMIHQHFMLIPTFTVAENVALGLKSSREPVLDLDKVSARIRKLSQLYGLNVDPSAYLWQLSVGEQQRVEIIKALYRGASLIILDEPTAVLTPQEVNDLFVTLKRMVKDGHTLIFISHKLHEVMEISSRVTVLRDGRIIGTCPTAEITRNELVKMMVGREVHPLSPQPLKSGPVRLEIRNLQVMGDRGTEALRGVDFEIHSGEIVGLAGVSGNGQRELAECLAGVRKTTQGEILLDNEDITSLPLKRRVDIGLAYIPEERMRDGAIRDFSVQENVFLHDHSSTKYTHGIFLDFSRMRAFANELVNKFNVKTPSLDTPIKNLSGGNIQKLIMARELSRQPKVLIAAQPTRGVDIGATEYIHQRLLQQREEGTAILLISEDLDEIRVLSDRIAVLYEGRIMGVVERNEATVEQIGLMMAGISMAETMQRTS